MKSNQQQLKTKDKIGLSDLIKIKRMKPYIRPTMPHKHQGYNELILITAGEGFHTIEFNTHAVVPPMLFMLQPNQVHHWEFTEKPAGYVLMFKPEFLQDFSLRNMDELSINEAIQLEKKTNAHLTSLFQSIEHEWHEKKGNYQHAIASYLTVLLIELERISSTSPEKKYPSNSKFQYFNRLVNIHFREKRKVNQFANDLHITPKHLNSICKLNSGKTASEIIHNHVITEAKRLLIYTDKSISEISLQLGFEDSSHFAKFFKTHTSLPPKGFRENRFQ